MYVDKRLKAVQVLRDLLEEFLFADNEDNEYAIYLQSEEFMANIRAAFLTVANILRRKVGYGAILSSSNSLLAPAYAIFDCQYDELSRDWYKRYITAYYTACTEVMLYNIQ